MFFGDKQANSSGLAQVMVAGYTSNIGRDMPEAMVALNKAISTAIGSVDPGPGASRHSGPGPRCPWDVHLLLPNF